VNTFDTTENANWKVGTIAMSKPMLKSLSILLILLAVTSGASAEDATNASSLAGKRIAFLGDSITQAGGYVSFTACFLEKQHPEKYFEVFGLGLASETLSGLSEQNHAGGKFPRPCLFERLERLLEKAKPEVVFACYGMNDGIYLPLDDERFAAFKDGVNKLIEQCQAAGVKEIYLITPPIFDFPPGEQGFNYDSVLTAYAALGNDDREARRAPDRSAFADEQSPRCAHRAVFQRPRTSRRRRPLVMARTILSALGVEPAVEPLATIKADPLFQQVDLLRRHRSSHWMNHIGYTREKTVQPQPLGDTETEAAKIREKIDVLKQTR